MLIALLIAGYIAPRVSPHFFWPPAIAGLLFPILIIANIIFLGIWFFNGRKFWRLSLLALLPALFLIPRYFNLGSGTSESAENSIRVLSWNVRIFNKNEPNARFEGRDEMLKIIEEAEPDIICLQEFYRLAGNDRDDHLDRISEMTGLKHRQFLTAFRDRSGKYQWGLVIFSRYPIQESGRIRFEEGGSLNACMYVDLDLPGGRARLFNTHLQSIRLSEADFEFVDAQAGINEKPSPKATLYKFRNAFRIRAGQADVLADAILESPHPVICIGDFNDPPMSYAYRHIRGDLKDAFINSGSGLGRTHSDIPIRIDYMFFDKTIDIYDYSIIRSDLSDHFPIVSDFNLSVSVSEE
ncbi:MAG: endonuclease/exonuclease/phosphatase family metal-dependent hydrolase [Limisphaerales bacterium]